MDIYMYSTTARNFADTEMRRLRGHENKGWRFLGWMRERKKEGLSSFPQAPSLPSLQPQSNESEINQQPTIKMSINQMKTAKSIT